MWLKKLSEVSPDRSQDVIVGTNKTTPLADAAGVAPVARTIIFDKEIDRSNPIDQLRIYVGVNVDIAATAMTPDGIGAILKNVTFTRQGVGASANGGTPRGKLEVVNCAGVDLLQRRSNIAKLDKNTFTAISTYAVRTGYNLCYVVDLAEDRLSDPLRAHTLCPVHLDASNPVLKLDFAAQSDMEASGGVAFKLKLLTVELHIIRRNMPTTVTEQIIAAGGFLEHDLISREFTMSANAKQRMEIESPGEYADLMLTTFSSATARGSVNDAADLVFDLQQQNRSVRAFTQAGALSENEESKIETSVTPWTFNPFLDFVSESIGTPDNNLGSLIDTNLERQNGQKTIVAFKGGGANTKIRWTARRFLSDIGRRRFAFA